MSSLATVSSLVVCDVYLESRNPDLIDFDIIVACAELFSISWLALPVVCDHKRGVLQIVLTSFMSFLYMTLNRKKPAR